MPRPSPSSAVLIAAALALAAAPLSARDQGGDFPPGTVIHAESVSAPVTPSSFDGDIRDLPPPPAWKPGDPIREIPRRFYPDPSQELAHAPPWLNAEPDPLVAKQSAVAAPKMVTAFGTPIVNVAGNPNQALSPPDVAGDVGANHFIQAINASSGSLVQIYDKTGAKIGAGFSMVSLGGTGACASTFGDPIVLYDRLADRWFLLEFTNGGTGLCVHVSKTADPVAGGWWNYTFTQATFPDYPHCSAWWDAYYCTANEGNPPVYAFDRAKMLTGAAATQQTFRASKLAGYGFQALTPVDFTGATAPPAGAQFILVRHDDDEAHAGAGADGTKDFIDMFSMHTDWTTPANSTFTVLPKINISEFNSWFLDYSTFATVPQPGSTSKLDPIREVILNRSNYRRFSTYETIVGDFATNLDPARTGSVVKSGVRWFELRRSPVGTGAWSLYQEGTYGDTSGTKHALEGAIAMDQSGNIALGFNVTDTSAANVFASIKYSGRLSTDPLGTMTQGENTVINGAAVETSGRWGDYASMGIDPVDDCTFWFTHEYRPAAGWATQIASFKFTQCGCVSAPPALSGVAASAPLANRITVTWPDSSAAAVTQYFVLRATAPAGPFVQIATVADTSPGVGNGPSYSYNDNTVQGGITYYYQIQANDGGACTSPASNTASATATGTCTLAPSFAGAASCSNSAQSTCTLALSWSAGSKSCPAASNTLTYNVYRSTVSGFTPAVANRIAAGVSGTGYTDAVGISQGTTYYYVVRAVDSLGNEDANTVQVSGTPTGPATASFSDNAGDTGAATLTPGAPWSVAATGGTAGSPRVYQTGSYANSTCASLTTPPFNLAANSTLSFASKYDMETGYDKGIVEISTNGGTTWSKLTTVNYPGNSTNTGDACALGATGAAFTGTNLAYLTYTASLSGFSGATTQLRWRFSSDTSITATGWWVDDIVVQTAATCTTGAARPPEVTPTGAATAMKVSKGSTAGTVVLNFADMAGATGYNVYEGALPMASGNPYTHGTTGNVCAAATTLAGGRRSTAAAGIGTAGSHYYLVTQYTTAEGPSGFNSSAVEIDPTKNTCLP